MASRVGNKLTGKVALVTGASKGIGRAIARSYALEGANVCLCARTESDLSRAALEIKNAGGRVHTVAGDVGRVEDVTRIVEVTRREFDAIHVLVNNASLLGPRKPIADYPLSSWEEVIRVNLTGLFAMTQEVLKIMIPQQQGSIINLSSGVGRVGKARWGAYAASKFAVEGFTQILAEEVKDLGVRVNAVNPGPTKTEMRAQAYPAEDPLTLPTPEQITGVFLYLASEESSGVTGKSFDARDWLSGGN